jgi:hypothetical protein
MKTMLNRILILGNFCFLYIVALSTIYAQEIPQLSQPKLVALPRTLAKENPLTLMQTDRNINSAAAAIKQVLIERQLEVVDLEGAAAQFDMLRAKMGNLAMDENALLASAVDADVYVEFTLDLVKAGPTTKAKVILNIKESATAKQLGSVEGMSTPSADPDIPSLCAQAVNNCIERAMEQVRKYWTEIPTRGKPCMLIISTKNTAVNDALANGKFIDGEVEDFLTKYTKSFRNSASTDKTLVFNPIYIDYIKYDSPAKFGRDLRSFFSKDLGLKAQIQNNGKSIQVQID